MTLRAIKLTGSILIAVVLLVFAVVGGRLFVLWQIKKAIIGQVEILRLAGTRFTYAALEVNPWKRSLEVTGISVRSNGPDSMIQSRYIVPKVVVEGIHLIPLILSRSLIIESVVFRKPSIHIVKQSSSGPNTRKGNSFTGFEIERVSIESAHLEMLSEEGTQALTADVNLTFTDLQLTRPAGDSLLWQVSTAVAKEVQISLPEDFYIIHIQSASYQRDDQTLRVDSLSMEPSLGRMEFAQQARHQIDQISCQVPFVQFRGFQITPSLLPSLSADGVELGFSARVFRDKRFPSAPHGPSLLPIQFMRSLPFGIQIDSLTISPSSVSYQELPESGGVPGIIFFDQLRAKITNVSTDSVGESVMHVTSKFMDAGDLTARFTFPLGMNKPYTVQAVLENFEMASINQMLEPLANLRVSSGEMQALKFSFQYDNHQSTGNLDVRYSDLTFKSLNSNKQRSINKFETLLINTIVQNTMDKKDSKEQRSGTISWKRDHQSSVLSYWWKSILSGIKSVYSLDKVLGLENNRKAG